MKQKRKILSFQTTAFLIFTCIIAVELILLYSFSQRSNGSIVKQSTLQQYADAIIASCKSASYRPSCYDKEIPKTMDTLSMEQAFQVTSIVQQKDPSYAYCHVLGHKLSAREVGKDPSKWKEVLSRCPSGMCSNGCIHGGFQEKFRKESLSDEEITKIKPDLESICEERANWHPTSIEQASCYHALGHLTMYLTKGEINKALPLCKELATKSDGRDFSHLCFDGAFMQIFQPLEPEDIALVRGKQPKKDTLLSYCSAYSGQIRGSCISESWPLFREEVLKPSGLTTHCGLLTDNGERNRCISSLVYVVTSQLNFDKEKLLLYCSVQQSTVKGMCFANVASRLIETDYRNVKLAADFCSAASDTESQSACFSELLRASHYDFRPGSKEAELLCNALPTPWKSKCKEGLVSSAQ